MHRRDFLLTAAAVGCGSLAGCADSDDGTDPEATEDRIEAAAGYLEDNRQSLEAFGEGDGTSESFDEAAIERRVDSAESELDEAEAVAPDEYLDQIETLRAIGEYQREAAAGIALFVDWDACMATAQSYVDAGRVEDSAAQLEECETTFEEMDGQFDRTQEAFDDVDVDHLDDDTRLDYEDADDEFVVGRRELDAIDALTDGMATFVDALVRFSEGADHLDREEWADAEVAFEDARVDFQSSADTLADLEANPDTPDRMLPDVIEFRCGAEALAAACAEFADGAAAAQRGEFSTAEDHFEAGGEEAERCE